MAKTKEPTVRMSPFEIPLGLYQLADSSRREMFTTWKDFLNEAILFQIGRNEAIIREADKKAKQANQPGGVQEI